MSEHKLQCSCVRWFRYSYSRYKNLLFAIPNGGLRNKIVAKKLKAEGVLASVPDLFLSLPNDKYHGLYIEMKYGKNKMSKGQKEMKRILEEHGYKHIVCYSFDEFKKEIEEYLKDK